MMYQGPTQTDYANVFAMNREFLRILQLPAPSRWIDEENQSRLASLERHELDWLATTPFLLFSLQQNNIELWRRVLQQEANADLFSRHIEHDVAIADLAATSVAFLWQLALQNRHAVRLVAGATNRWCDDITAVTCIRLVSRVRHQNGLIVMRRADNPGFWRRLLHAGVNPNRDVRSAAHIAALQFLLTYPAVVDESWAVAACKVRGNDLRVADKPAN